MAKVRDNAGRFIKGHPGNPNAKGRPKRKTEEKYLRALQKSVTQKDWRAIAERAVSDAKRGDKAARQWLSDYLLGKPQQFVDVTSAGEALGVLVYLPEIDELETESGAAGEISS
ncbi:MAG: hypothetical protein KKC55_16830 [Gammaproteobacteria bacterium]|nr:hypothetical protein [Gammaproteobacteria bacterium]